MSTQNILKKRERITTYIKDPRVPQEEVVGFFVDLLQSLPVQFIDQVYQDMFDDELLAVESQQMQSKLDGLFKDTISPALFEDFGFTTPAQVKWALETLIGKLQSIKPTDIVPMDLD